MCVTQNDKDTHLFSAFPHKNRSTLRPCFPPCVPLTQMCSHHHHHFYPVYVCVLVSWFHITVLVGAGRWQYAGVSVQASFFPSSTRFSERFSSGSRSIEGSALVTTPESPFCCTGMHTHTHLKLYCHFVSVCVCLCLGKNGIGKNE